MEDDTITRIESLDSCHKDCIVQGAWNGNDEIWINVCNIYGFREEEAAFR